MMFLKWLFCKFRSLQTTD